jgi:hypothetical protein
MAPWLSTGYQYLGFSIPIASADSLVGPTEDDTAGMPGPADKRYSVMWAESHATAAGAALKKLAMSWATHYALTRHGWLRPAAGPPVSAALTTQ